MGGAPSKKLRSAPCLVVAALVATTACSGNIDGSDGANGAAASSGAGGTAGSGTGGSGKGGSGKGGSSGAAGSSGAGTTPNALGSKVRRLSRAELDNSVRDAL